MKFYGKPLCKTCQILKASNSKSKTNLPQIEQIQRLETEFGALIAFG
jgi:hypothetical protein